MRPIKLTMTAFGPYREQETIDFGLFGNHRLFVISGSTGAGKTTIFDAICYALYGEASGEDRAETRMLRSDFAGDDLHTAVDFTFAAGKRTFRVFRQMGHRKGNNKSETGGKVELYEVMDAAEVPAVDRFMISDVNEKLEQVIGLNKDQFSQIVMLPQGEFRKLLTSDSENKEEILRRIFKTELFQKLEERFQQKNRFLKERHKEISVTLHAILTQTVKNWPVREGSLLAETFQQEFYQAEQVAAGLDAELHEYTQLAETAMKEKENIRRELDEREVRLRTAHRLNERFDLLQQKEEMRNAMQEQYEAMLEKERCLQMAEKAARIMPYEELEEKANRDADEKRRLLQAKQRDVIEAERRYTETEDRYKQEEARENERKAAEREWHRLQEFEPVVQGLEIRRREIAQKNTKLLSDEAKLRDVEVSIQRMRADKQQLAIEIERLDREIVTLPEKQQRLEEMRSQARVLKELVGLEQQLVHSVHLEAEYERQMNILHTEHNRIETEWIEGQAALLSAHLHDGEACPVCGSLEHPRKVSQDHALPDRETVQAAKDKLLHVEREWNAARAQAAAARSGRDARHQELTEFRMDPASPGDQLKQLEAAGKKLRAETDHLQKHQVRLRELRAKLAECDQQLEQQQSAKEDESRQLQSGKTELATMSGLLQQELDRIPEPLRSPDQLIRQLQLQQQRVETMNRTWKTVQQQRTDERARYAEEKAHEAQLIQQLAEVEQNLSQARARFALELEKAGLPSVQMYLEAKRSESERSAWKHDIDTFRQMYAAWSEQIKALISELNGQQRADTAVMEGELAHLNERMERVLSNIQHADHYRQEAGRLKQTIEQINVEVRQVELHLAQVTDIYQTMKGDNALKISFERYMLIEVLEQIIHAANLRLQPLSNGQFTLQRSERLEARGRQSGLGLDVYDAYTGQNRDVKSLSGGEKFNASLCLALGMTDVIQMNQGGVSIEMMFIDEGFGSLDEDSLHKAIATLIDLQRAGRMIGVISHVSELKEVFPAILEVSKTREGYSRTSVVVKS